MELACLRCEHVTYYQSALQETVGVLPNEFKCRFAHVDFYSVVYLTGGRDIYSETDEQVL